jgi:hypothetical protein
MRIEQKLKPRCRKGRPEKRKSPWSALQTHLQGLVGATLAMAFENPIMCSPPFSKLDTES